MWWYGRGNSGGSWLPEEKKANMWPGRGNSGGAWTPVFPRSYIWKRKINFLESTFTYSDPETNKKLPPLHHVQYHTQ